MSVPQVWQKEKAASLTKILDFIDNTSERSRDFSKSLIAGIFWEETYFTNRRQLGGPAVGFGQIQVKDAWTPLTHPDWQVINPKDPRWIINTENKILSNAQFGIKCTCSDAPLLSRGNG